MTKSKIKSKLATVTKLHEPDPFLADAAEQAAQLSTYLQIASARGIGSGDALLRALSASEALTKHLDDLAQTYEIEPAALFGEMLGGYIWERIVERHAEYCKNDAFPANEIELEIPDEALIIGTRALGRLEQVNGMSIMRLVAKTFAEAHGDPTRQHDPSDVASHIDELAQHIAALMMGIFAKKPAQLPHYWLIVPHAPLQEMNLLVTVSNDLCGHHEGQPAPGDTN
jgi:hypothetical protein